MSMPSISLTARPYGGRKPIKIEKYSKRLDVARRVNEFLNSKKTEVPQTVRNLEIMEGASVLEEDLRDLLSYNGKGPNGITY